MIHVEHCANVSVHENRSDVTLSHHIQQAKDCSLNIETMTNNSKIHKKQTIVLHWTTIPHDWHPYEFPESDHAKFMCITIHYFQLSKLRQEKTVETTWLLNLFLLSYRKNISKRSNDESRTLVFDWNENGTINDITFQNEIWVLNIT